jgi:TetR/AcrR family transcriptional repressor of nem operon
MSGSRNEIKTAILDAAERRLQAGGFGGFSFRDIAADVGIKSSSVHYHFPTKEDLAAAVVHRWTERASAHVEQELQKNPDPVRAWINAFRSTAFSGAHMCPCTVLGAASQDLPEQVATGVKQFFEMCRNGLVTKGVSSSEAAQVLATITGALVVANALRDTSEYDRATDGLFLKAAA